MTRLTIAAVLVASGCSSSTLLPRRDADPAELAEIKSRILELQRTAAMTRVEIDRLRQEVVALQARLEGSDAPPPAAEVAIPPAAPEPPPPVRSPTIEVADLEPEPTPRVGAAAAIAEPPAATPPPAAGGTGEQQQPVTEAAQALYDRGYTLYHQGRYVDAESSFRRFLQAYPETSLSDNAQYWIGESRFARGDLEGALAAFQEAAGRYPGGNKVADSLLKAADCLSGLGDQEAALVSYEEVIRRFPGSAAAAMAEERRARLRQ